jgi:polysaccharide deacetylase 2 family uncharacterized protein YibQ
MRRAIRAAGGSEVWIRPSGGVGRGTPSGNTLQILAASSAYRDVLSALRDQAAKAHLQVVTEASTTPEKLRAATLNLTSHSGASVMQVHLREVRKILRAAIVIDDVGNDLEPARELAALEYPITFSVLPYLRATEDAARQAHANGHEVMLHLPMEPEGSRISPGKGAILVGMSAAEVEKTVEGDLDAVPFVRGVNNHMGSRATEDAALMDAVMETLAGRHLYFIDSRTTAASVALKAARAEHVPAFYRSVFLDDTESVDYTLGQLRQFRRIVERDGVALAIGHPHATTIAALKQFLPEFEHADIELVTPSQIVRLPEILTLPPSTPHGSE